MAAPSLYDRLGVAPTATQAEIRAAYRRLARAAHPDHAGSARDMAALNDAWRVLSDPARRAAYDRSVAAPRAADSSTPFARAEADDDVLEVGEHPTGRAGYFIGLPWVLVLATLALIFVFTAYAARGGGGSGGDDDEPRPDGLLQRGDCVQLRTGHPASEARCSGPHDAVVIDIVTLGSPCPRDSEPALGPIGTEHLCLGPG